MAVYDNNGTANAEIGKLYDDDGTTNYQIGKVYDNDGTTDSLIYTSAISKSVSVQIKKWAKSYTTGYISAVGTIAGTSVNNTLKNDQSYDQNVGGLGILYQNYTNGIYVTVSGLSSGIHGALTAYQRYSVPLDANFYITGSYEVEG